MTQPHQLGLTTPETVVKLLTGAAHGLLHHPHRLGSLVPGGECLLLRRNLRFLSRDQRLERLELEIVLLELGQRIVLLEIVGSAHAESCWDGLARALRRSDEDGVVDRAIRTVMVHLLDARRRPRSSRSVDEILYVSALCEPQLLTTLLVPARFLFPVRDLTLWGAITNGVAATALLQLDFAAALPAVLARRLVAEDVGFVH